MAQMPEKIRPMGHCNRAVTFREVWYNPPELQLLCTCAHRCMRDQKRPSRNCPNLVLH